MGVSHFESECPFNLNAIHVVKFSTHFRVYVNSKDTLDEECGMTNSLQVDDYVKAAPNNKFVVPICRKRILYIGDYYEEFLSEL